MSKSVLPGLAFLTLGLGGMWWVSNKARAKKTSTPNNDDTPTGWQPYSTPPIDPWMPTAKNFPMGWSVADSGFGADDSAGYNWRLLQLDGPSDACKPEPCRWVVVFAGSSKTRSTGGWKPLRTKEEAYDLLEVQIEDYS